jgi:putative ATP-dependent endonuclease of OLD family
VKLTNIRIQNFRAHADTTVPLSQLGCLIGENNAGKSSVLHALQFVLEEKKLSVSDFRNKDLEASVVLRIEDIDEDDLSRVGEAHRERVASMIRHGALTLVRTQAAAATAESRYMDYAPMSDQWDDARLETAITGKKGANLRAAAVECEPRFADVLDTAPKISDVREQWRQFKQQLPEEDLMQVPTKFATGISAGMKPLLPSVIYIEAVKDATAEAKPTGSATFSKLLELLFTEVEDQLGDIEKQFAGIHSKLSRVLEVDGKAADKRLPAVKLIESTIERFVQNSFPDVKLQMNVPAPTLTTILSGAELTIDDGHLGMLASKGDGLKRTVLFAILRAYTELRGRGLGEEPAPASKRHAYMLLFEEPELYLHPRAQRQLMAALEIFARDHQVLVTTHSPGFFTPTTSGFAKLQKTVDGVLVYPVDIAMQARDAYQLIHHENNEAAFFARTVVLVEGDSDTITFPHLAKMISKEWDQNDRNIMFVKTGGKGSITRYRDFFDNFKVPVHVITDLDSLADGFNHLTVNQDLKQRHSSLMAAVNEHLPDQSSPNGKKVKNIVARRNAGELWRAAQGHLVSWRESHEDSDAQDVERVMEELFDLGHGHSKESILAAPPTGSIEEQRDALIAELARERVYVLKRGDLEVYCGGSANTEKVDASITFCNEITTVDQYSRRLGSEAKAMLDELRGIFTLVFAADKESALA